MDDSDSGIIRILSGKSDSVRGLKSFWLDIGQKPFYTPVFDSYTHKNPSKTLINSAFFEGLFALKMC